MHINEFSYDLPTELIADYPSAKRSESRLLCLDSVNGAISHQQFSELMKYIRSGDLLVFNDTKVIPARFFGEKESGGKIEVLIERVIGRGTNLTIFSVLELLTSQTFPRMDPKFELKIKLARPIEEIFLVLDVHHDRCD